ncbi:MAG: sulfide/dihydroorotate dehydrogenase-like FAD/NAD-binding protein [Spirochaetota bacterium]|nr:sulfide/dihydroorotate dehydrogenase-like FAD/NAD-binding protein [Spirochaetota bacterium]
MYKIIAKRPLNSSVVEMVIEAPYTARKCAPGQFIILRVNESGERIPLTIAEYDAAAGTVSIIFQVVGYSTRLLAELEAGDAVADFVGPLGQAAHLEKKARILGIGGGVGAAPLYPQIRALFEMGVQTDVILGGRMKELVILEDKFRPITENLYIMTDDGSYGEKGVVTDKFKSLAAGGVHYDEVIAIGPLIMMKFVVLCTRELNIPTMVSLNPIMVDGTGMCGCCRVSIFGKTKFACVDGPDFDGFGVDFDELMRRQTMYKEEEQHICKIGL